MSTRNHVIEVIVENKPLARDPEGETIHHNLIMKGGYNQVTDVRAGKLLRMTVEASSPDQARDLVKRLCDDLRIYNRAGAIAATSPSLKIIREAVDQNKPVLGICNGLQILVEAGILPGAVLRNRGLRFVCAWTRLRVETTRTPFTNLAQKGQTLCVPIAHNEGRYYLDSNEIHELEKNEQIVMRYVNEENEPTEDANPNGSIDNIAGICNEEGNVMGLMPHPERASLPVLSPDGRDDGRMIFDSMIRTLNPAGA